jgi:hypothetical protein
VAINNPTPKTRFTFYLPAYADEAARERVCELFARLFPHRPPEEIARALARPPLRFAITATPRHAARIRQDLLALGAPATADPDPESLLPNWEHPLPIELTPVTGPEDEAPRKLGSSEGLISGDEVVDTIRARLIRSRAGAQVREEARIEKEAEPAAPVFFWDAWVKAVFSPRAFFGSLRRPGGTFRALLFAATVGLLAGILSFPARSLSQMSAGTFDWTTLQERYLTDVFTEPLEVVLGTVISALLIHLGLRLFSGPRPFEVTVKVLAYTTAAAVFAAIPWVGAPIAGLIGLVLSVIGLVYAQRVRPMQAVGAIFFPALAAGAIILITVGTLTLGGLIILHRLAS